MASGEYALDELDKNSADHGSLVNAGRAGPEQPKRFYKFALIDPVDQPFATFRYHYRTWDQLRELGLLDDYYAESEVDDMSIIEPGNGSANGDGSTNDAEQDVQTDEEQAGIGKANIGHISVHDWAPEGSTQRSGCVDAGRSASLGSSNESQSKASRRDSISSGTYVHRDAPSEVSTGSPQSLRRRGRLDTYRLSMPPSIKFDAPEVVSRPLPLPQKHEFESSTAYRPHPAYPVDKWTVRTPGSVRSFRDGITTPPLERRTGLGISGAGLMGGLLSTWKRSVSNTQLIKKTGVDVGIRSASH